MWFRVNTHFKQSICVIAFAMWATNLCAAPKVVEGFSLKQPLSISLDFSNSDYLLVRAAQTHTDYSLELISDNPTVVTRKVDFPYGQVLDEIFLVRERDCKHCEIRFDAVEPVDTNSPYKVSIISVDQSNNSLIDVLEKLTLAGEYRHKANQVQGTERESWLTKSNLELKEIIEAKDSTWHLHALTLLANNYSVLGDPEKNKEILSVILNETENEVSVYRANALLKYAAYETDQKELLKIYDNVIGIGHDLDDQRIIASGRHEKAVNLVKNAVYTEAFNLLNQARLEFLNSSLPRDLMLALHNLAWASQRAGKLPESLSYATRQLLLAELHENKESQVLALYNFAMTYRQIGEPFLANGFLDKAITLHNQLSINSSLAGLYGAYLLHEKTQTLLMNGAFDSALDYAEKTRLQLDKFGQTARSADVELTEGQIALALGNYDLAEDKYKNVIRFDRENNRVIQEGSHLLHLAKLKIAQKEYIEASKYQSKALEILSATKHYLDLGRAFSQTAELLYHLGASQDAQSLLDRTSDFIDKYSLEPGKANLAIRKALIAHDLGNNEQAISSLTYAKDLIEQTLPKIHQRNLRQTYFALQKSIFELSIKVLLSTKTNDPLTPLALAETYKARTLAESINTIQDDYQESKGDLAIQRQSILDKIQKNALLWHADNSSEDHKSLLANTRELSQQLEKLEVQIANSNAAPRKVTEPITVSQLPSTIEGEIIVYYFIGKNISWLWVITDQLQEIYELPSEQEITDLVNTALRQINTPPSSRQNSTAWDQESAIRALSDILLSPLEKHLENSAINLITIIPDGPLHGLPFAPLKLPSSVSPLIKDYALSYAPSLMINRSLSERLRQTETSHSTNVLVLANPINSNYSNMNLANLPYSQEEAMTIKSIAKENVTLLLSEKATKDNLQNELSKTYSILHFATHGLLNKHEPSLSGLALSTSNTLDNDLWLSPEISNSDISADLVILSACDSSLGKSISGEGLFSLSRAFIEGGANQVIGTLWRVQDNSTSALFNNFYSYLFDQNLGVAEALQKAQLALYLNNDNDWSDPYYWAGFQLLGGGANQAYAINQ